MSLCYSFKYLSSKTWLKLSVARKVDHQVLEESITDFLMVNLKFKHPTKIYTKTFNRREEFVNGADWEWWLIDSTGCKGIGFRVQAKIINFTTNSFNHLNYKSKKSVLSQTQKLIDDAQNATIPLIPIYCLYLHYDKCLDESEIIEMHLNGMPFLYPFEPFGCSILSAFKVKNLNSNNQKHIKDVFKYLTPWHSLVCHHDIYSKKNMNLPERTLEWIKKINFVTDSPDDHFKLPNIENVPNYVRNIINDGDRLFNENNRIDESFIGLGGIMVIKE